MKPDLTKLEKFSGRRVRNGKPDRYLHRSAQKTNRLEKQ